MTTFDPHRPDFAPYGFTCDLWRPSLMPRPDRHNEVELNLLRSGSITYLLGGRKVQIPAMQLSAFWAAFPHQLIHCEDSTEYFVVTLPLAWFLQCKLPDTLVQALLRGDLVRERSTEMDTQLMARWVEDFREPGKLLQRATLLELEARLLRLAMNSAIRNHKGAPPHRPLSSGGLSKVEQMACFIAQCYARPLSVEEIGASVGLHPNYAMSLFKKNFGTTLVEYVTQHRVSHAQRLLATTDDKVVDVALASGFNSISRFNAAFLAECGCSPRQYRRQHRTAD